MKPTSDIPFTTEYGTEAVNIETPSNAQWLAGVEPQRTLPAAWWNFFINLFTDTNVKATDDINNILTELTAVLTAAGITPDPLLGNQLLTALNTLKANIASPTFTGVPAAPTAAPGTNTTQLATTAFVAAIAALKANIASPTFTGVPAAPTADSTTDTTQLATTAFVQAARPYSNANPLFNGIPTQGISPRLSRQDHVHPVYNVSLFEDFMDMSPAGFFGAFSGGSGTGSLSLTGSSPYAPGIAKFDSGGTNYWWEILSSREFQSVNNASLTFSCRFNYTYIAELVVYMGFHKEDNTSTMLDGAMLYLSGNTIRGRCVSGGSAGTSSTFTLIASTWYVGKVEMGPGTVVFSILDDAGNVLWTANISSNVPRYANLPARVYTGPNNIASFIEFDYVWARDNSPNTRLHI